MSKSDYLSSALFGRLPFKQLPEAALIFWHCGVGLLPAKVYLDRLEKKLHDKNQLCSC